MEPPPPLAYNEDAEREEALRFLAPDKTAAQLLRRTFVQPLRTGLPLVDRFTALRGGQVLEIASAAGAGRTTALLQVAATCVLPEALGGVHYGGQGAHVLLFDLDSKLDVHRLLLMLLHRIEQALAAVGAALPDPADQHPALQAALARLHVVRCHSSFEFLAALRTLRPTLDALAAAPGGLAALLIDNVAAFHYLDKAARGGSTAGGGAGDVTREGAPLTLHRVHTAVAAALRGMQQRYRRPIIATKHLLFQGGRDAGGDPWAHRETMLKPWADLVTHRLVLRAEAPAAAGAGAAHAPARHARLDDGPPVAFDIGRGGIALC